MKFKRKQKGFTLIELLIVLAIFSIILTLVMSFIDPVSKLMTKTSVRERTASSVDNIGDYLDKSLRYSKFMRVYKGDYGNRDTTDLTVITEEDAVQAFADDFFDGALADDLTPLKGTIHVLRLYNDNMPDSDDKPGVAYESVYSFTAGDSCTISHTFPTGDVDDPEETITGRVFDGEDGILNYGTDEYKVTCPVGSYPRASVVKEKFTDGSFDHMILNREHFVDYSYYYDYGFKQLEPIKPSELSSYTELSTGDELPTSEKFYYSRIVPMVQNNGTLMTAEADGANKFALNVIAYQNNAKGINMIETEYSTGGTGAEENVSIFKSPSYMTTTSMSLRNCMSSDVDEKYFKFKQSTYTGTGTVDIEVDSNGKPKLVAFDPIHDYYGKTFEVIDTAAKNSAVMSKNIYIIYALPDEVSPSPIKYE